MSGQQMSQMREVTDPTLPERLVFGTTQANRIADLARIEDEERELDKQLDRELATLNKEAK